MCNEQLSLLTAPVVILADGEFPFHDVPLGFLREAGTIVCCDAAAEKLVAHGMLPDYIVGDLDSLSDSLKARFSDRLFHFASQETNDLTKAVAFCVARGVRQLAIVGGGGLREDHTIANVSLLADYAKTCRVEMITNYGIFSAIHASTTFACEPGQQVSLFSLTPMTPVSISGCKYPLHNARIDAWWKGSLNETTGHRFTVTFQNGAFIVFRVF
jgi:thiamine pyrophosphokinase